jgi:hypothetical protein
LNATPSNYIIATSHLDATAPIDSGSFDSSRVTLARIHALLAIADEVRQLREEIVIVAAAITGRDAEAGGLRRVLDEHIERMARRQPD